MGNVNLKHNILMSGSFRIIVMVISFLTSIVTTRYLGVELKGKFSYLFTLSGFIWMVLDLGLYRSFPYLVRKFPEKIGSLFTWSIIQFVGNTFILTCLGLAWLQIWNNVLGYKFSSFFIFLFVLLITVSQLTMQLQSLYLGLNKIWKHSLAQMFNSLVMLVLVVIGYFAITKADKLALIIIATIAASGFSIIYYLFNHNWKNLVKSLDFRFIQDSYKTGFRVFMSTLFIMLLIRCDIIIIKRLLNFSQVGYYSIAAHIVELLQIASNMVGGLLLVKLTDSSNDVEKWLIMKKLLMAFFVMLAFANLGFIILGKFLIITMYGRQFVPVYNVYLWLIPASFGLSFGSLFNMYLNSKGFPIISIVLPAIAAVINVILNFSLIPVLGIKGSALATSISFVLWFIMIIIYEQHCSKGKMFKYLIPERIDWNNLYRETRKTVIETFYKITKMRFL